MATISVREPTKGFPFSNVISMSDGTLDGKSTGIPYMYMTDMEMSTHDLHVSLTTNSSDYVTNLFPQFFYDFFSPFEQLKKKTNFLLAQNRFSFLTLPVEK
jgi:hypothetical protein